MTDGSSSQTAATRWNRFRRALTPQEWRRAALLATVIVALHVVGFGLLAITAAQGLTLGSGTVFGFALGITAYTLGARHAFDADHIAAIDNAIRKLVNEGQRPLSVGFFFSLGHSTIVFVLAALLAVGIRGLSGAVEDDSSALQQVTSAIGPTVAGVFLLLIGVLNLIVLVGIVRVFLRMRRGDYDERGLERQLDSRRSHEPLLPPSHTGGEEALVLVALVIGPVSLISVLSEKLSLTGGFFDFVTGLNLDYVGYAIVGIFVLAWGIALAIWRFGRIEERWSAKLQQAQSVE